MTTKPPESLINDYFETSEVFDDGITAYLWSYGWRHFGGYYFRYNFTLDEGEVQHIVPVRIDLERFQLSKSQRRVLRKNADLEVSWEMAEVDDEMMSLFGRHVTRFKKNIPGSLLDFVASDVGTFPCQCEMFLCRLKGELIAASYCDFDGDAASSVYGMFDPQHSRRGLGLFTLLMELQRAKEEGRSWHYLGYASEEPSIYEYKKNFTALQGYDWVKEVWKDDPFSMLLSKT